MINKVVAIIINSQKKGFLVSLGIILEKEYNIRVRFIARDPGVMKFIENLLPDRTGDIILSEVEFQVGDDIIHEALGIEKKYDCKLSMLMSEDRALGQGYLFNVEKVPNIIRASWPNKDKLRELITNIEKLNMALSNCDFVISSSSSITASIVCNEKDIHLYSLVPIKFGSRELWSDNNYLTSSNYIQRVKDNLSNKIKTSQPDYAIDNEGVRLNKMVEYTYKRTLKTALQVVWNDSKKWIRGLQVKDSYHFLGWLPSIFRGLLNYRYVKSISIRPDQVSNYKLVFFPLHLEPEISLLSVSPEFNNSMEVITYISKSLPSDAILVLKERAHSFPVRSRWYYKQINKIGNVMWADPDIHSWDWINNVDIVATISGTVGIEAVHLKKPIISYGTHQVINYLPTVYFASNYKETYYAVNDILTNKILDDDLEKSKHALGKAQIDSSVEIPNLNLNHKSFNLDMNTANMALKKLFSEYPYLLEL